MTSVTFDEKSLPNLSQQNPQWMSYAEELIDSFESFIIEKIALLEQSVHLYDMNEKIVIYMKEAINSNERYLLDGLQITHLENLDLVCKIESQILKIDEQTLKLHDQICNLRQQLHDLGLEHDYMDINFKEQFFNWISRPIMNRSYSLDSIKSKIEKSPDQHPRKKFKQLSCPRLTRV